MDVVSKLKRSKMMSGIKSRNTKPELLVRRYLHSLGFRFRLHKKIGSTKPDLVLKKYKTCVFVHGCFWHRHDGCHLASSPKSNAEFWRKKFDSNLARDKKNIQELNLSGWTVGVIWECSVRNSSFKKFDYKSLLHESSNWEIGQQITFKSLKFLKLHPQGKQSFRCNRVKNNVSKVTLKDYGFLLKKNPSPPSNYEKVNQEV